MRTLLERGRWHITCVASLDSGPSSFLLAKSRSCRAWLVGVVTALGPTAAAFGADIRVFTDEAHPVRSDSGTRIILLDASARITAPLGANLPADPRRATELVAARLKEGGPALQRDLAAAYQGVIEAWRLGLTKIPAIVVDHRYVVYGEPDVARALSWIDAYRSAHP